MLGQKKKKTRMYEFDFLDPLKQAKSDKLNMKFE